MKNVLIYANPKGLGGNEGKLVKIQIDNLLELQWDPKDIMFFANFQYEYNGIKSILIGDDCYYERHPWSTKTYALTKIFEAGLIKEDTVYWMHDLDNFQLEKVTEEEVLEEMGTADVGLCDYGRRARLNGASVFFKRSAEDIFWWVECLMYEYGIDEESAFMVLYSNNRSWIRTPGTLAEMNPKRANMPGTEGISKRIQKMNITYNFIQFNVRSTYFMAKKPLRTVHFNPFPEAPSTYNPTGSMLDFFMYGKNNAKRAFVNERLAKIFNKYGIK